MNIIKGKIKTAQKVVIYGPEGIGKSTFASHFPDPLFIDTEGSTKNLDVARMDKPTSWTMLKNQINYVKNNMICKTLIVDTIDWAEQLCIDDICSFHNKKGIEDFGYGNGYVYEKEEFGRFLNLLEELIERGINVVLTAHAQMRKFSQPDEIGEYDRWELKLGKKTGSQISPLVKEWADMVLFANYKIVAVATDSNGKKFKAQGGSRIMYTQHHPCWDAKNRHNLDDEIEFNYDKIAHLFTDVSNEVSTQTVPANPGKKAKSVDEILDNEPPINKVPISSTNIQNEIPKNLADLMQENNVTEDEIRFVVSQKGYYPETTSISNYDPDFINGCLVAAWGQVFSAIMNNRDLPFL